MTRAPKQTRTEDSGLRTERALARQTQSSVLSPQHFRSVGLLISKDLRIELRSRQALGLVTVLGILVVTVLGLGLGGQRNIAGFNATAVLWVAYLFSGVLVFEKTMSVERHDGALASLMLVPMDRGLIYIAKLVANLALMTAMALVVTPIGVVFFGFDLSAAPVTFVIVMALGLIGFAAVGTLFATIASSSKLAGGLLSLMVFPTALPLVIASTQMMLTAFRDGTPPGIGGIGVLAAFDAIFLVVSWAVFEWTLEP